MFLVSHRVTNHLLPCQTAHLYSSLASVVVLQTVTIPNNRVPDWLAHVPKEVLAKNFQMDISAFNQIPSCELYIFPARMS